MATKKKAAPSPKTEALSIRIDPRLRYGLEMMARKQRRSVTGVVEWAIDAALKSEGAEDEWTEHRSTFADLLNEVWRPNEVERLVNLAQKYPRLLTYEETRQWEVIKLSADFWESAAPVRPGSPVRTRIRRRVLVDQWEKIQPLIVEAAEKAVLKGLSSAQLDAAGVTDDGSAPDDFADDQF